MTNKSSGLFKCEYIEGYGYKAYVEVDTEIVRYFRAMIPKWIKTNPQKYSPHISVIRKEKEPVNIDVWNKFLQREEMVGFEYENKVNFGTVYCWFNCFSKRLEEIRLEMGLPVSTQYTRPPEFTNCIKTFHCTIGNFK